MAILLERDTRVLVQGITGREGAFHASQMVAYGTRVVGGVTPGKGGEQQDGIPVYNTVREAVAGTGATASTIFVPPPFAADAIMEAAEAGLTLIVCISEGIPVLDMIRANRFVRERGARLIGPNCPGVATAGQAKMGIMPNNLFKPGGRVGLVSRSGTLTYEAVSALTAAGIAQSTCVGIGGDPIIGSSFVDILQLFEADPRTEIVMLLGEIGGSDEERAADYLAEGRRIKVVGFISGRNSPPGKRMGHAGAIVSGNTGTAAGKIAALEGAGVPVAATIEEIVEAVGSL